MSPPAGPDLRCAAQMRAMGADPVGTSGCYDGYLLVEWPGPWPADLAAVDALAPVLTALRRHAPGEAIRLQGLVPERPGRRRLVLHRRPAGPFAGYARQELDVPASPSDSAAEVGRRLGESAAALLARPVSPAAAPGSGRRDLLVCTHGRRDRCCGSWGTELWQHLSAAGLPARTALWRTSHTGGHRYAPTIVVLPEATVWGFVDAASTRRILGRDGPAGDVRSLYRGCAGLPSPAVQALERAVLAEVGWALLDTARRGEDLGGGRVALVVDPDGACQRWEATVTAGRVLPVPDCGALPSPGGKTSVEQVVRDLARTA